MFPARVLSEKGLDSGGPLLLFPPEHPPKMTLSALCSMGHSPSLAILLWSFLPWRDIVRDHGEWSPGGWGRGASVELTRSNLGIRYSDVDGLLRGE